MSAKVGRGGYRRTEFGDLVKGNPELAAKALRDAWATGGATDAARKLGISRRSFFRCADRLESCGYEVRRPSDA